MNRKLLKFSNAIEELRLPTRGLKLRTEFESLLLAFDSIVLRTLYYAFKWLKRGLNALAEGMTTPLFWWALLALVVAYGA